MWQWLRSIVAGGVATGVDLAVLAILVSGLGVTPHAASVPALLAGGVTNFVGNRHFAIRAKRGSLTRQAIGYTLVEVVALVLNGLLYELVLRALPASADWYWLVRLATSNAVFLAWSYPLWRRVFRVPPPAPTPA